MKASKMDYIKGSARDVQAASDCAEGDLLIQKLNQIIFCKAALSQDSVQSAFSKLIMERDNSFICSFLQADMASFLTDDLEASSCKKLDELSSR
jgi:hypothetical protein